MQRLAVNFELGKCCVYFKSLVGMQGLAAWKSLKRTFYVCMLIVLTCSAAFSNKKLKTIPGHVDCFGRLSL
jgi:hypothetical protein